MRSKKSYLIFLSMGGIWLSMVIAGERLYSGVEPPKETKSQETKSPAISFGREIQPILTKNCAIPECHTDPKPPKGMILTEGDAYWNLVNSPSKEFPKLMKVTPGDLKKSYLYDKITGNQRDGDRMPPKKRLTREEIELIKNWILAGAPNDSVCAEVDTAENKASVDKKGSKN